MNFPVQVCIVLTFSWWSFSTTRANQLIVLGLPAPRGYWTDGIIHYLLDPTFSADQRTVIRQQLSKLERNVPCGALQIQPLASTNTSDYVYIQKSYSPEICAADGVGRHGGEQNLFFGDNCFRPDRQHEIMVEFMHVLGFLSEHQRPDRDQYIQVLFDNIVISHRRSYYRYGTWFPGWRSTDPYDIDSLMHYSDSKFAHSPELRTFIPVESQNTGQRPRIGPRTKLNRLDKIKLQRLFPCKNGAEEPLQQNLQQLMAHQDKLKRILELLASLNMLQNITAN